MQAGVHDVLHSPILVLNFCSAAPVSYTIRNVISPKICLCPM